MAYIKVDHSKFAAAAAEVDSYVSKMRTNMRLANMEVQMLGLNWQGSDFTNFKAEWSKVDDDDSTYKQMAKALESYSDFLKYAAGKYKEAQSKAVNRANSLPRY